MPERNVLLQQVIYQRTQAPRGFRIWSDGTLERSAASNSIPQPTERLDKDRSIVWEQGQILSSDQLRTLETSIRECGVLHLPPALLLNYCTEDPGTAIWQTTIDGQTVRIVVWDPRPHRSQEIDHLLATINSLLAE